MHHVVFSLSCKIIILSLNLAVKKHEVLLISQSVHYSIGLRILIDVKYKNICCITTRVESYLVTPVDDFWLILRICCLLLFSGLFQFLWFYSKSDCIFKRVWENVIVLRWKVIIASIWIIFPLIFLSRTFTDFLIL